MLKFVVVCTTGCVRLQSSSHLSYFPFELACLSTSEDVFAHVIDCEVLTGTQHSHVLLKQILTRVH
jgi:hypothetical protein